MAANTGVKGSAKYAKAEVLHQLHEAKQRVEETIITHEQAMTNWRAEAPIKFAEMVKNYPEQNFYIHGLEPPRLNAACNDYRVQALNKIIARVVVMDGDVITLRGDDPIWDYVGLAACL